MSFQIKFDREAWAEAECAAGDYAARDPELGHRFRRVLENALDAMADHPLQWRERSGAFRRVNLPGFPYYLAFVIREELLVIVAVAHASRDAKYWSNRLP